MEGEVRGGNEESRNVASICLGSEMLCRIMTPM